LNEERIMPTDYLDSNEALRQLNLYFDVESLRANLLLGDRARLWEEECGRVFRRLWAVLKSAAESHHDEQAQQHAGRALGLLSDVWDVPALVIERGLRPETAGGMAAGLTRMQAHLVRLRRHLREIGSTGLERSLQEAMDDLAFPVARLAAHVNALTAVYDLLMVRPALRILEHWLFDTPAPVEHDEEAAEVE
jgi:hypothetical protein